MYSKNSRFQKMTSQGEMSISETSVLRMPLSPLQAFLHKNNHFQCKTMSQLNSQGPSFVEVRQAELGGALSNCSGARISQGITEHGSLPSRQNKNKQLALPSVKDITGQVPDKQKPSIKTHKIYIHQLIKIKERPIAEQYELLEKIGEGTYGQVFRGINKKTHQQRAIKVIKRRLMSEHKIQQFLAQTTLLKKISHPSIIRVYDLFQHQSNFYLVLQYCQGGSVQSSLKYINFKSEKLVAVLMKQVLAGLAYLHSLGIVHRDIKADNIVFLNSFEGQSTSNSFPPIKIIDFGTAVQTQYKIEHSNSIAGTLPYLAPEVFKGFITQKSDIWSSAVLMIKMLTGVNPLAGANKKETQMNVVHKVLNFYQKPFNLISEAARDLLQKMFDRNFHKRLSAADLLRHPWFEQVPSNTENLLVLKQLEGYEKKNNFVSVVECFLTLRRLTQSERQNLAQIFCEIDKDNSGLLDKDEFLQALRLGSPSSSETHLQMIIDSIDKDKSGKIDFNQFLVAMADRKRIFMKQAVEEAFQQFDVDRTGFLEKGQLKKMLACCSMKEVEQFICGLDIDKDNLISKQEFIDYLEHS